jgi:hypothetical protein
MPFLCPRQAGIGVANSFVARDPALWPQSRSYRGGSDHIGVGQDFSAPFSPSERRSPISHVRVAQQIPHPSRKRQTPIAHLSDTAVSLKWAIGSLRHS